MSVCPFVNDLISYQHLNSWTDFYIIRYKMLSLQVAGKLQSGLKSDEKTDLHALLRASRMHAEAHVILNIFIGAKNVARERFR